MERIDVDGRTIAFEKAGSGPPLVLLHGGISDSRSWRPQIEALSDAYTVVAWDAPGCGQSADPPESFRLPEYADTLARFVEAVGLDRPHVLGLSFGGGLALELYRRHPHVPRTLILASAYAGWAGSLPPEEVAERLERALRETRAPPKTWAAAYLPSFFGPAVSEAVLDETLAMIEDARPAGTIPMLKGFAEADLRDVLPRIAVPTLLLYGDADVRSPLQVAEALHREIPGSELVVLSGVGHCAQMEAPERFNAEVRRFLTAVDPES
jgi:pimeloyl-ACP methyl ester carboxylesterase